MRILCFVLSLFLIIRSSLTVRNMTNYYFQDEIMNSLESEVIKLIQNLADGREYVTTSNTEDVKKEFLFAVEFRDVISYIRCISELELNKSPANFLKDNIRIINRNFKDNKIEIIKEMTDFIFERCGNDVSLAIYFTLRVRGELVQEKVREEDVELIKFIKEEFLSNLKEKSTSLEIIVEFYNYRIQRYAYEQIVSEKKNVLNLKISNEKTVSFFFDEKFKATLSEILKEKLNNFEERMLDSFKGQKTEDLDKDKIFMLNLFENIRKLSIEDLKNEIQTNYMIYKSILNYLVSTASLKQILIGRFENKDTKFKILQNLIMNFDFKDYKTFKQKSFIEEKKNILNNWETDEKASEAIIAWLRDIKDQQPTPNSSVCEVIASLSVYLFSNQLTCKRIVSDTHKPDLIKTITKSIKNHFEKDILEYWYEWVLKTVEYSETSATPLDVSNCGEYDQLLSYLRNHSISSPILNEVENDIPEYVLSLLYREIILESKSQMYKVDYEDL